MTTTIENHTKLTALLKKYYFQSSESMLDSFKCCSVFRAILLDKSEIRFSNVNSKFTVCLPSKYPVSVGFSGFGIKGGSTDSKLSQSIDSKNCIL